MLAQDQTVAPACQTPSTAPTQTAAWQATLEKDQPAVLERIELLRHALPEMVIGHHYLASLMLCALLSVAANVFAEESKQDELSPIRCNGHYIEAGARLIF